MEKIDDVVDRNMLLFDVGHDASPCIVDFNEIVALFKVTDDTYIRMGIKVGDWAMIRKNGEVVSLGRAVSGQSLLKVVEFLSSDWTPQYVLKS